MARSMPKSVRGTLDYVLFTGEHLGRGSMGNVCIARHRKKGTRYAAKMFTTEARTSHGAQIKKELDILGKIPTHQNIINLISVQHDKHSQDEVVIMELCEGGSLQKILDQPQNYYGLPEVELMLVLEHITCGLHHLYRHRIVHRDIKPGNILLSVTPDGRHIYKLTDFGASRSLDEDGEEFKTMCGTEEYLHPNMHTKAFVRKVPNKYFGAEVDLWSFAVTLYQCATGQLPYRPARGIREDRKVMSRLMEEKAPGVISNIELDNGSFQASRELPATTRLSCVTRRIVTDILARLMNTSDADTTSGTQGTTSGTQGTSGAAERWSPTEFYHYTSQLFNKTRIKIFCANICDDLDIYLDTKLGFAGVQKELREQLKSAGVPSDNPLLLITDGFTVREPAGIDDYMKLADGGEKVYLYVGATTKKLDVATPGLPEEGATSMSGDATWAKTVYGNILYHLDVIRHCKDKQHQLMDAFKTLTAFHNQRRVHWSSRWQHLQVNQKRIKHQSEDIHTHYNQNHRGRQTDLEMDEVNFVVVLADSLCQDILHKRDKLERNMNLLQYDGQMRCDQQRCEETAEVTTKEAKPLYDSLIADKHMWEPSHNEMEIHRYNKQQLVKVHNTQHKLVSKCVERTRNVHARIVTVIMNILKFLHKEQLLETELTKLDQSQQQCDNAISQLLARTLPTEKRHTSSHQHDHQHGDPHMAVYKVRQDVDHSMTKQRSSGQPKSPGGIADNGLVPAGQSRGTSQAQKPSSAQSRSGSDSQNASKVAKDDPGGKPNQAQYGAVASPGRTMPDGVVKPKHVETSQTKGTRTEQHVSSRRTTRSTRSPKTDLSADTHKKADSERHSTKSQGLVEPQVLKKLSVEQMRNTQEWKQSPRILTANPTDSVGHGLINPYHVHSNHQYYSQTPQEPGEPSPSFKSSVGQTHTPSIQVVPQTDSEHVGRGLGGITLHNHGDIDNQRLSVEGASDKVLIKSSSSPWHLDSMGGRGTHSVRTRTASGSEVQSLHKHMDSRLNFGQNPEDGSEDSPPWLFSRQSTLEQPEEQHYYRESSPAVAQNMDLTEEQHLSTVMSTLEVCESTDESV